MCIIGLLKIKYFAIKDFALILSIGIIHFVFFFFIKVTDFQNIFDVFESSPLFDFSISDTWGGNDELIFHIWEGSEETDYYYSNGHRKSRIRIVDVT